MVQRGYHCLVCSASGCLARSERLAEFGKVFSRQYPQTAT
jgi:hypothetical protein